MNCSIAALLMVLALMSIGVWSEEHHCQDDEDDADRPKSTTYIDSLRGTAYR